jgi:hypothetical protein
MKLISLILMFVLITFSSTYNDILMQAPYELVLKESSGGPTDPQILVIKEQTALKKFYSKVNQTRRPGLAIPAVNFKKECVVILCMGTKQTTGHEISIKKAEKNNNNLVIFVEEMHPENNGKLTKVFNEPFSVYRIQGNYKNIEFKKAGKSEGN